MIEDLKDADILHCFLFGGDTAKINSGYADLKI
jgi:hypothetical protein